MPQGADEENKKWMKRDDALAYALQLASQGNLQGAEEVSRQLMEKFKDNPNIIAARSFILFESKQPQEAIKLLEGGLKKNPNLPVFHSNLCEMYRQTKDLAKAEKHGKKAVEQAPGYAEAHNNLGIVRFERADFAGAEEAYKKAIEINPKFSQAYNNLGNVCRVQARHDEARQAYTKAVELNPQYPEALTNLARSHMTAQEHEQAEKLFRRAAQLRPNHMEALTGIANAMHAQGKTDQAMTLLSRLTSQHANEIEPYLMLAQLLLEENKHHGALASVKQALALNDSHVPTLMLMGRTTREMGETEESIEWFKKALEIKPDNPDVLNQIGVSLVEIGEMEEAEKMYHKALEIAPGSLRIHMNMASAHRFKKDDPLFESFMNSVNSQSRELREGESTALKYALGKAHDDIGEGEKAMNYFIEGAKAKRKTLDYNEQATMLLFDRVREVFNKEQIEAKKAEYQGHETDAPILVLGMPRSGSTLTEQIISSHPDVFGAGEIRSFNASLLEVIQRDFSQSVRFPEVFKFLSPGHMEAIADGYIKHVPLYTGQTPRFTDKMLTNFFYLGLMHVMMPKAKIIHIQRHPVDTCISCFTKHFREDLPYSYNFEELSRYYKKYYQLMQHWRDVLPEGAFMDVRYEDVVEDTENQARRLLEFCDLSWDEKVLEFYKTKRPVKTASVTQVREPIYKRSVRRWEKYGETVQPLVDLLSDIKY